MAKQANSGDSATSGKVVTIHYTLTDDDGEVIDSSSGGEPLDEEEVGRQREAIRSQYQEQSDIRFGAARGWVDAIIAPHETRHWLAEALRLIPDDREPSPFRTGVLQV